MTGRIFTADHHVYDLPPLLSWNVRHTGTVPCDSWSVTAVYQPEMLTVLRMAAGFAAIENGMTQLRGIVDEYTVELGSRGMTVTLSGRGHRFESCIVHQTNPLEPQGFEGFFAALK